MSEFAPFLSIHHLICPKKNCGYWRSVPESIGWCRRCGTRLIEAGRMQEREDAIKLKAYLLWERDGRPSVPGPDYYWQRASAAYDGNW